MKFNLSSLCYGFGYRNDEFPMFVYYVIMIQALVIWILSFVVKIINILSIGITKT